MVPLSAKWKQEGEINLSGGSAREAAAYMLHPDAAKGWEGCERQTRRFYGLSGSC